MKTWHARYCPDYWRLYDLIHMSTGDYDAFDPVMMKLKDDLEEHLKTCTECKREKTK